MGFFRKDVPEQRKTTVEVPVHDQLDVLRNLWLARLLEAGGDLQGAALARSYAALADAANEAKYMYKTYGSAAPEWEHRHRTLKLQLQAERQFWRPFRPEALVDIQDEDPIEWPTDAELLAGA